MPVVVRSRRLVEVGVEALLRVAADRVADEVAAAARTALASLFDPENRGLGQSVTASEVVTVLQRVPGVVAAHLTALGPVRSGVPDPGPAVRPVVTAEVPAAGADTGTAPAAVLLVLVADAGHLDTVVSS